MIAHPAAGRIFLVSLGVFDGPLDLLLRLVKEQQLDIATLPLATLAQQYLAYIALMEVLDIEIAAEYLAIAATLVFLKSKSLLPPLPVEFMPEGEETAQEVEERLRRRLITYSKYRGAADELRRRQGESSAFYHRDAGDPASALVQRYRIPAQRLADAFLAVLRAAKPGCRTITRERISLRDQIEYVVLRVSESRRIRFSMLCSGFDQAGVVITFLAVLELIRQLRITYEQPQVHDVLWLLPYQPKHRDLT